jgi:hypothetical protein
LAARRAWRRAIAFLVISSCAGCSLGKGEKWNFASWDVRRAVGLGGEEKPDPEIPVRLVTTWTEAVHHRTGQKPQRGFGGRLAFFKNGSDDPVRVDGQLVVYAYDETGRQAYETEPTRRYIFPSEQFAVYESDSKLGPSYSIWLPWDDLGGPERKVSLIAKFEPRGGPPVLGEQTKHYLAGPPESILPPGQNQQMAQAPEASPVQPASYQGPTGAAVAGVAQESSANVETRGLDTATIALPKKLAAAPGASLRRQASAVGQIYPALPVRGASAAGTASESLGASAGTTAQSFSAPNYLQPRAPQWPQMPTVAAAGGTATSPYRPTSPPAQLGAPSGGFQSGQFQAPTTPGRQ